MDLLCGRVLHEQLHPVVTGPSDFFEVSTVRPSLVLPAVITGFGPFFCRNND